MPSDVLRRHLLAMAPSPEAFLTCRGGFARSLATLSACCYIMGIGDRHLDNFLLDTTTGYESPLMSVWTRFHKSPYAGDLRGTYIDNGKGCRVAG